MRWKRLVKYIWFTLMLPVFVNLPLACVYYQTRPGRNPDIFTYLFLAVCLGIILASWLYLNIGSYRDQNHTTLRLRVMRQGTVLVVYALLAIIMEVPVVLLCYKRFLLLGGGMPVLVINTAYAVCICLILLWNGILRMFLLSYRLRVKTRVLMIMAMWIPGVNLFVLLYARRLVLAEYDFACYKEAVRSIRAESSLCKTRYPLILVHGVGFRDLKYFNYWGRIPNELTRYGAVIYYGNQEAMGTIAYNAGDISQKIKHVIAETGCEKVNIIAHSKGGLDARYAISQLGMAEYVASLTTINTPHHGCRFVDYALKLPDLLYRLTAKHFDRVFRKFGDRNPDFYTATRQFSTATSRLFNQQVPDAPGVYYQSYTSVMRNAFSDMLLWLPYLMIYPLEGDNDGLVSVESAKWGNFRMVFKSRRNRGISHGDIIDLKREDYKGFDVVECFVQIVKDLVQKGF